MMPVTICLSGLPSEFRSKGSGSTARVRRILGMKVRYIDHPSFADPTVLDVSLAAASQAVDEGTAGAREAPRQPAPPPAAPSGAMVLSRDEEALLFCKLNYLKSRAHRLKERLDPERPSPADLDEIERLLAEALAVKNRIVEMNLRLVVSIAKTRVGSGYGLSECLSDGNFALIQAVDGFDFARGNKFSTYATRAIRNQLGRNKRRSIRRRNLSLVPFEDSLTLPHSHLDEPDAEEVRERQQSAIRRWLCRLEERERRVLASHYGLGGVPRQTLTEIGQQLGISKERVRQIEDRARAKLRKWARLEGIEPTAIECGASRP
jgi:RNA polymerase primary sigma factor